MMQRRKAEASATPATTGHLSIAEQQQQQQQQQQLQSQDPRLAIPATTTRVRPRVKRSSNSLFSILVFIVLLVGLISILSPSTVEKAEREAADSAKEILNEAYVAEQQMEHFFHRQLPPLQKVDVEDVAAGKQRSLDATDAMKRQPSKWVEGEKKLKLKLKGLVELQKEGKELGVPVLTRWLGDDFPAWVSEGMDKDAWESKRKERYAAMAGEEVLWRTKTRQFLEKNGDFEQEVAQEIA